MAHPPAREVLGERETGRDLQAEHVRWDFQVNRSRRVAVAQRRRPALVEVAQDVVRGTERACAARDRPQDRHVINALKRAEVVLLHRRTAADEQHRYALELRVGDGGDAVGDARAGGGERDTDLAGQHRVAVCHVHGGAFVAHVDDAHAALCEPVPDRLDVPALQAVHSVHALGDEELDDPLGDRPGCAHHFLLTCGAIGARASAVRASRLRRTSSARRRPARRAAASLAPRA